MVPMPKVSDTHKKLIIVSGPTATGKTKLAVELSKTYSGELVSADSRQVYRGIDIISGKDKRELDGIPLWLTDVASVDAQFSVSLYRKLAVAAIEDIISRAKQPIIVGGTGLYIQSIIDPPSTIDIPPDDNARARWDGLSVEALRQELDSIDDMRLKHMNQSDRNNSRRLIRALEIVAWQKTHGRVKTHANIYDSYWVGLRCEMEGLQERIENRVEDRWKHGALEEELKLPAEFSATGVQAIRKFLAGELSSDEAKAEWVHEETSYAKRQMTWFQKQKGIHWYDSNQQDLVGAVVRDIEAWYT